MTRSRRAMIAALAAFVLAASVAACGAGDTLIEACADHGGQPRGGFQLVEDAHRHGGDDADTVGMEARCADGGEAEIDGNNRTAASRGWIVD